MHGLAEWFGDVFENIMALVGGVAAIVNGGLLIAHFLINVTMLDYWDRCGVSTGPISGIAFLLWTGSPLLVAGVQVWISNTDFDQFHAIVFAALVGMIAAYDVWFFMAFAERGDAVIKSVWDENFVHSGFCEFTRLFLPDNI